MTLRCVPVEPTMGQWDDFCTVHSVRVDLFLAAYKAMMKNAPPPPPDIAEVLELAKLYANQPMNEHSAQWYRDSKEIARALLKSWGRE